MSRYIRGKWIEESDCNVVFDIQKFLEVVADFRDVELMRAALRVARHALERVYQDLVQEDLAKVERDAAEAGPGK